MHDWAAELLDAMQGVCELLDNKQADKPYGSTLAEQRAKLLEVERTPSARLLAELKQQHESFPALGLRFSREHREQLTRLRPRNESRQREFEALAQASLAEQAAIEASERGGFEDYLAHYLQS